VGENLGEEGLRRVVLLPFELRRSDLPLQIAFPILIANSVDWLAPAQGVDVPASVRPGDVAPLPEGSEVTLPDATLTRVDTRGFAQTNQAGVYRFKLPGAAPGDAQLGGAFAVNFINPAESDITPSRDIQLGAQTGAAPTPAVQGNAQQEFWHWLAVAALLVLVAEWWVFQRGVPALKKVKS
jgi:Ca-activated chloride channel homolog